MAICCLVMMMSTGCDDDDGGGGVSICSAGETTSCECDGGLEGYQICGDDGARGECICDASDIDLSGNHGLGVVTFAETSTEAGEESINVQGQFWADGNDYEKPVSCTESLEGQCEILRVPDCEGACGGGESCVFDESCEATCQPLCTLECGAGQECYFPAPGVEECRAVEAFDAGAISLLGGTDSFSFNPPYSYQSPGGVTLLPEGDAELTLSAEGSAAIPGFSAFEFDFDAPARPAFTSMPEASQFFDSDGDITLEFESGNASAAVYLSSQGGLMRCAADDASGSVTITRDELTQVLGEEPGGVDIRLERRDWHLEAGLELLGHEEPEQQDPFGDNQESADNSDTNGNTNTGNGDTTNQDTANSDTTNSGTGSDNSQNGEEAPEGHSRGLMAVQTVRSHQTMLLNCPEGQQVCGGACVDTDTSNTHCGSCGNSCEFDQVCQAGTCETPCQSHADCGNDYCDFTSGECVECTDNTQCDGGVCDDRQCVDCTEDFHCEGAQTCTSDNTCDGCLSDDDCGDDRCLASEATCVACLFDTDCPDGECNTETNECVECTSNGDCPDGACDLDTNQCVECQVDGDCPSGVCEPDTNQCVACVDNSQCGGTLPVCTADNTCEQCAQDSDCPGANGQCTDDYICISLNPGCSSDFDCPVDQVCEGGECVADGGGGDCFGDIDCSGSDICHNGQCTAPVPTTVCYSHDDCIGQCDFYFGDSGNCVCDPPNASACYAGQGCCSDGQGAGWCDTQCY